MAIEKKTHRKTKNNVITWELILFFLPIRGKVGEKTSETKPLKKAEG